MIKGAAILAAASIVALTGCATYTVPSYSVNTSSIVRMQSQYKDAAVSIGEFTSTSTAQMDRMCRAAGHITPLNGQSFTSYIRNAFKKELVLAGIYDPASNIVIIGDVNYINFSSTAGVWEIAATVSSNTGVSISKSVKSNYAAGFVAEYACRNTANAFMPAVKKLIRSIINDPLFPRLIGVSKQQANGGTQAPDLSLPHYEQER